MYAYLGTRINVTIAADAVEWRLDNVLGLAESQSAILLLDECDVFLQERQASEIPQNENVVVFSRSGPPLSLDLPCCLVAASKPEAKTRTLRSSLEYYRSILLTTTKRAENIVLTSTAAHLILHYYPGLDAAAKEHIWRQFAACLRPATRLTDANHMLRAAAAQRQPDQERG
ncbi:hypothetical protein CDD83_6267 [Cordyceps sp. RAO-2017]|nr:hypothetical protein CDD83_6267 [Cordyceps sp. RAO-2017]